MTFIFLINYFNRYEISILNLLKLHGNTPTHLKIFWRAVDYSKRTTRHFFINFLKYCVWKQYYFSHSNCKVYKATFKYLIKTLCMYIFFLVRRNVVAASTLKKSPVCILNSGAEFLKINYKTPKGNRTLVMQNFKTFKALKRLKSLYCD